MSANAPNITQQLQAEIAKLRTQLAESEARYRTLAENIPDTWAIIDTQGTCLEVTTGKDVTSYLFPDQAVGKTIQDILPPDVARTLMETLDVTVQTGNITSIEIKLMQNGQLYDFEVRFSAIENDRIFAIFRDVTERKHMEDALRFDSQVLDNVSDGVYSFRTSDNIIIQVNRSWLDMFGYQEDEVIGQHASMVKILNEATLEEITKEELAILVKDRLWNGEVLNVHKDGTPFWSHSKISTFMHPVHGEVWVSVRHDITERKKVEETLEAERTLLRTIIEHSPDAIYAKDLDGRYTLSNSPSQLMSQITNTNIVGKTVFDVRPEAVARRVQKQDRLILEQGQSFTNEEYAHVRADGVIHLLVSKVPIRDARGNIVGLVGISRDITERKKAEAAFVENEKLQVALEKEQELAELQTRFITTMSHELRTPLASIILSTEILLNYGDKLDIPQQQEKLERILLNAKSLRNLLDDFGFGLRAERGYLQFHPSETNLKLLCQEIISLFAEHDGATHTIIFESAGNLDNLWLDDNLIRLIVTNLISNAVKYSPAGGEVRLEVTRLDTHVKIECQDQGIGIPAEDQERLFTTFYRASNVGAVRGTGVGLSIIKSIVNLHSGTIDVQSTLNQGTTFTIVLPITKPQN